MKKTRTLMGEVSWQRTLVLPSKEVVGTTTWSFVKFYGCENRSKYLVRYFILYSVTLSKSFYFGTFPWRSFGFRNFDKSGRFGLPPPKNQHCLLFHFGNAASELDQVTSKSQDMDSLEINAKQNFFLEPSICRSFLFFLYIFYQLFSICFCCTYDTRQSIARFHIIFKIASGKIS